MDDQFLQHGETYVSRPFFYNRHSVRLRYRRDSVPWTGVHRRRFRVYKRPPHRREIANAYLAVGDELPELTEHQVAQLEKYHWVPDPWTDEILKTYTIRSWKKYRGHQWK